MDMRFSRVSLFGFLHLILVGCFFVLPSVSFAADCAPAACLPASACPVGTTLDKTKTCKDSTGKVDATILCCMTSVSSDSASAEAKGGCAAKGGECLKVSGGCSAGYACRDEVKPGTGEILCSDGICCKPMTGDALKKCQDAVKTATEGSPTTINNPIKGDLLQILSNVIKALLGFAGSVAFAAFVYAGVMYVFSAGDASMVTKAKDSMKYAAFGIFIIIFAYALTSFFVKALSG